MSVKSEINNRGQDVVKTPYDQIITHFSNTSQDIFIFLGFKGVEFIQSLSVDYILISDITALNDRFFMRFRDDMRSKNLFLICDEPYKIYEFKRLLNSVKTRLFFITFDVMKYFFLVDKRERRNNKFIVGIDTKSKDFMSFVDDEVMSFVAQKELSEVLTRLLQSVAKELKAKRV